MAIDPHIQRNPDGSLMYPWYDPRNFDSGISEAYAAEKNQALSPEGGSQINPTGILAPLDTNPGVYDAGGSTSGAILTDPNTGSQGTYNELYAPAGTPRIDELRTIEAAGDLNPAQRTELDQLLASQPTGGGDGGLGAQIALARGAYENRMGDLRRVFDEARGIYDQGMGTIGKRRGEFKDIYDTGNNDILTSFEGERGNLQRSAIGNVNTLRNILRATGMGGSAFTRGIGSQDKSNLRNLGSLSNEKTFNERENLKGYNTNQEWAGNQEGELGRYLRSAQGNYDSGVEKAGLVNMGDVAGINNSFDQLRSNIYSQKAALEAAGGNVAAYKADPFAPNLSDMTNSLNVSMPNFATPTSGTNEAANVNPQLSYFDLLKKRAGGTMYT